MGCPQHETAPPGALTTMISVPHAPQRSLSPTAGALMPPNLRDHPSTVTRMRVVVDMNVCESNALCMGVAPEVFEVGDDDVLRVLDEHPGEELRARVEEAVRLCPKQAISIEE